MFQYKKRKKKKSWKKETISDKRNASAACQLFFFSLSRLQGGRISADHLVMYTHPLAVFCGKEKRGDILLGGHTSLYPVRDNSVEGNTLIEMRVEHQMVNKKYRKRVERETINGGYVALEGALCWTRVGRVVLLLLLGARLPHAHSSIS